MGLADEAGARTSMAVVSGIDALEPGLGRLFVVVGVFDGLHLGHEYLLRELRHAADAHDARPAVVTFDHHPDEILKGSAPPLLCDPAGRLERLAAAGVAVTVVQTFDVALRETLFDGFIGRIADRVDLAGFLMTPESAFGFERRGTPETVAALGHKLGYDVVVVPQFNLDGQPIRSSDIRAAIASGDLAGAARLLGRPYSVVGEGIEVGATRVAMLFKMPVALPPEGTYDVTVEFSESGPRQAAYAAVDSDGELTLGTVPFEGRAEVVFVSVASGYA
jgi:riboflavin kinase/FMN adenylyltransferase